MTMRRVAITRLIVTPHASTIIPADSLARTVTRHPPLRTQPPVSAPRPMLFVTATAQLPARALPAKSPSKSQSAGLAAVLA